MTPEHGLLEPLPIRPAPRAAVVSQHARRLLDEARLDEETRVRIAGALRACESMTRHMTTMPGVSHRKIVNAAARDVANTWTAIHGMPPWGARPLLLRWIDR